MTKRFNFRYVFAHSSERFGRKAIFRRVYFLCFGEIILSSRVVRPSDQNAILNLKRTGLFFFVLFLVTTRFERSKQLFVFLFYQIVRTRIVVYVCIPMCIRKFYKNIPSWIKEFDKK